MGRSHLLVGAAGMVAVGAPVAAQLGLTLSGPELAAAAVVGAGASMLPDVDHPNATVAHSLGPVTHVISKVFAKVFGGHRNGTHSLMFAGAAALATHLLLAGTGGPWAALGLTFFFCSLLVRTLTDADGLVCAAVSAILACTLVAVAPGDGWLVWAVGMGCLWHMLGDIVTPEGTPPLWPVSKVRLAVPLVGHTGDWREKGIATAAGAATCWMLWVGVFAPAYVRPAAAVAAPAHRPVVTRAALRSLRVTLRDHTDFPVLRDPRRR